MMKFSGTILIIKVSLGPRLRLVYDVALMEGRIYTLSVYRVGHAVTQFTPYATLPRAALEPIEQAAP